MAPTDTICIKFDATSVLGIISYSKFHIGWWKDVGSVGFHFQWFFPLCQHVDLTVQALELCLDEVWQNTLCCWLHACMRLPCILFLFLGWSLVKVTVSSVVNDVFQPTLRKGWTLHSLGKVIWRTKHGLICVESLMLSDCHQRHHLACTVMVSLSLHNKNGFKGK